MYMSELATISEHDVSILNLLPDEIVFALIEPLDLPCAVRVALSCHRSLTIFRKYWKDLNFQSFRNQLTSASLVSGLVNAQVHLTKLSFKQCFNVQVRDVLTGQYPNLTYLDVSGAGMRNSLDDAVSIFSRLPNLVELNIGLFDTLTDEFLSVIAANCSRLRRVWMGGCPRVTRKGLNSLVSKCPQLNNFNFFGCYLFDAECISLLTTYCPKTSTQNEFNSLLICTDSSLSVVSLDVSACFRLTDSVLAPISQLSQLRRLSLRFLSITDAAIESICRGCLALEYLNLGYCENITDGALRAIAASSQELIALNLWRCCNLTFDGVKCIVLRVRLRNIDLSCWGNRIGDNELIWLSQHAPSLERIHLQEADVGDRGVSAIAKLPNLTNLDIYRCDRVTDDSIFALGEFTPKLRALNCSGCPRIRMLSLNLLCERCPALKPSKEEEGGKL